MRLQRLAPLALSAAVLVLVGACSNSPAATTPNGPGGTDYTATAKAELTDHYKGTNSKPDTTSRKPTPGKKVVVISAGEASLSSPVQSDAAVEAAKLAGWNVTLYDQKLNP